MVILIIYHDHRLDMTLDVKQVKPRQLKKVCAADGWVNLLLLISVTAYTVKIPRHECHIKDIIDQLR